MQNASHGGMIDDLYRSHHAAVLRVCSRILRNPDDAADAAQEVFLIALESLDHPVRRSTVRAWLLTVARNHCLDLLRRQKRLERVLVTLGPDASRGSDPETAVADRDFIGIVFRQLSKRERQALWQSAVESRPLADVAGRLRLSYMAAAQVLHRARRHAMEAAARVAVVFGIYRLGRATRFAALATVPLIAVSMQSSSAARQAAPAAPAPAAAAAPPRQRGSLAAPGNSVAVVGSAGAHPTGVPNPDSLIPGSTATLNSALNALGQLRNLLPSIPPVSKPPALPSALPSVLALPSPPPLPGAG